MNTALEDANEDLEVLRSIIRGCDEALGPSCASLEPWELREYQQVREEAVSKLAIRETAISSAQKHHYAKQTHQVQNS